MKRNSSLILLLALLFIKACSDKPALETSKVRFSGIQGLLNASGGLVIAGFRPDQPDLRDRFVFITQGDTGPFPEFELENANWKFIAMAWSGTSGNFTGSVSCEAIEVLLNSNNQGETNSQNIALNLNSSKCNNPLITSSSYLTGDTPDPLSIRNCNYFPGGTALIGNEGNLVNTNCHEDSDGDYYPILAGKVRSLYFNFHSYKTGVVDSPFFPENELASSCYDFDGTDFDNGEELDLIETDLRLPFDSILYSIMRLEIQMYFEEEGCPSDPDYEYNTGIMIGPPSEVENGLVYLPKHYGANESIMFLATGLGDGSINFLEYLLPNIKCTGNNLINCMTYNHNGGPDGHGGMSSSGSEGSTADSMRMALWDILGTVDGLDRYSTGEPDHNVKYAIHKALSSVATISHGLGVSSCAGIPTSGTYSQDYGTVTFSAATKTYPGGASFDKRFEELEQGVDESYYTAIEFSCTTLQGWYQEHFTQGAEKFWQECWWDASTGTKSIECYSTRDGDSDQDDTVDTKERMFRRVEVSGNTFELWHVDARDQSGTLTFDSDATWSYTYGHGDTAESTQGVAEIQMASATADPTSETGTPPSALGASAGCINFTNDNGGSNCPSYGGAAALSPLISSTNLSPKWITEGFAEDHGSSANTCDSGGQVDAMQCKMTAFPQ